ncbi:hypothetical protein BDF14DRAFT_1843392 [Spinellus fusiger]|nr:hypothetical protein BDF14DRAFT_1843392 [Spinellus fusiger]
MNNSELHPLLPTNSVESDHSKVAPSPTTMNQHYAASFFSASISSPSSLSSYAPSSSPCLSYKTQPTSMRQEKEEGSVSAPRKRMRATPYQLELLEKTFNINPSPNNRLRAQMTKELGMSERSIQVWFQNRRAKMKNMAKRSTVLQEEMLHMQYDAATAATAACQLIAYNNQQIPSNNPSVTSPDMYYYYYYYYYNQQQQQQQQQQHALRTSSLDNGSLFNANASFVPNMPNTFSSSFSFAHMPPPPPPPPPPAVVSAAMTAINPLAPPVLSSMMLPPTALNGSVSPMAHPLRNQRHLLDATGRMRALSAGPYPYYLKESHRPHHGRHGSSEAIAEINDRRMRLYASSLSSHTAFTQWNPEGYSQSEMTCYSPMNASYMSHTLSHGLDTPSTHASSRNVSHSSGTHANPHATMNATPNVNAKSTNANVTTTTTTTTTTGAGAGTGAGADAGTGTTTTNATTTTTTTSNAIDARTGSDSTANSSKTPKAAPSPKTAPSPKISDCSSTSNYTLPASRSTHVSYACNPINNTMPTIPVPDFTWPQDMVSLPSNMLTPDVQTTQPITLNPTDSVHPLSAETLQIGTWRRLRLGSEDLVCAYDSQHHVLVWCVWDRQTRFKIEIETRHLQGVQFQPHEEHSTWTRLEFRLSQSHPIAFYMEDPVHRSWTQCRDFTQDRQGTHVALHLLEGPVMKLQTEWSRIVQAMPFLSYGKLALHHGRVHPPTPLSTPTPTPTSIHEAEGENPVTGGSIAREREANLIAVSGY